MERIQGRYLSPLPASPPVVSGHSSEETALDPWRWAERGSVPAEGWPDGAKEAGAPSAPASPLPIPVPT